MEYLDVEEPKHTNVRASSNALFPQQLKWSFNLDFCAFPAVCPLVRKGLASHFSKASKFHHFSKERNSGSQTKVAQVPYETFWRWCETHADSNESNDYRWCVSCPSQSGAWTRFQISQRPKSNGIEWFNHVQSPFSCHEISKYLNIVVQCFSYHLWRLTSRPQAEKMTRRILAFYKALRGSTGAVLDQGL